MGKFDQPCYNFPFCICGRRLNDIDPRINDWIANPVPRDVIVQNMIVIYCALRCVEAYSSRPTVRQSATLQLLHPVWNALPKEFRQ